MLREELEGVLERIAVDFAIRMALLFGSAVTGRVHAGSDIDVAILFDNADIGFSDLAMLQDELQRAAGGREIDLALLNRADPFFLKKITESCVLLFGEVRELYQLKMLAFRRYQDYRPCLRMEREYVKRLVGGIGA